MRTTPYKDVTRAKCERCGAKASHEWQGVCSERSKKGKGPIVYHALCRDCDVGLNRRALVYVYGKAVADELMRGYE